MYYLKQYKEVYFFIIENKSVLDRVLNEKFGWKI